MILHKSVSVTTISMARLSRYWSGELECLKRGLEAKTSSLFLWHTFVSFIQKEALTKSFRGFDQFCRSYDVTTIWIHRKWRHTREFAKLHTRFSLRIFVNFMKKKPSTKFYGILVCFSRTWWNLDLSDVIHVNKHT